MDSNWLRLNVPSVKYVGRTEIQSVVGLSIVLLLLCVAAIMPGISEQSGFATLPGAGSHETPLLLLSVSLIIVAALGLSVIYLRLRCRALEAARSADNHAALHDPMTGAANRRHFEQQLTELVDQAAPSHTLLMIDLDRFKPVNDLYGHAAGDALLCEISAGFESCVGVNDVVARLGGDEFALLLRDCSESSAESVSVAVLEFVKKYRLNWQGQRISVGTSIGLVHVNRPGFTSAGLLAAADEALYCAKEAGRGAVFCANFVSGTADDVSLTRVDAGTPAPESSARSHEPEDGRRQELYAVAMASVQPNAAGAKRSRLGSRRRHVIANWVMVEPLTVGDDISPGMKMQELLDNASARGDGGADLARWVMLMTLDAASRLSPTSLGRIGFVLPIPARAIVAVPELADDLMRINALSHQPIRHLTFVLHNASAVYDSPALEQFHHGLNSRGARLGFEVSASTLDVLAPLNHVAYDEVHLGRELSKNVRPGTSGYASVEALINIAEQKGVKVVASNVDTEDELRHLALMGVNRFAGPVVNQPAPLCDVLKDLG